LEEKAIPSCGAADQPSQIAHQLAGFELVTLWALVVLSNVVCHTTSASSSNALLVASQMSNLLLLNAKGILKVFLRYDHVLLYKCKQMTK